MYSVCLSIFPNIFLIDLESAVQNSSSSPLLLYISSKFRIVKFSRSSQSFASEFSIMRNIFISIDIYLWHNSKKCFYIGTKSKTFTHFFCWHLMNTSPLLFKCGNVWKANDSPFKKNAFLLFSSWCVLITYIHKIPIIVRVYQFPVLSFLFWKLQIIFSF